MTNFLYKRQKGQDDFFMMSHSDIVKVRGENKSLTEKLAGIDGDIDVDALSFGLLSADTYTVTSAVTKLDQQPRKKVFPSFVVGKTYIIEATINTAQSFGIGMFLYAANDKSNTNISFGGIKAGATSTRFEYTPKEGQNYQWFGAWMGQANSVGSIKISYCEKMTVGKVAADTNKASFQELEIDLSQFTTKNGSLTTNNSWWTSNGAKHKSILLSTIGVVAGDRLHIKSEYTGATYGGFIGWLKATETTTTYQYVDGSTRVRCMDEVLIVPEGAMYLCLTVVDGDGTSLQNYVGKYASINEAIERDEVPTSGSSNLVTSGGVYDALENKISKYDVLQSYKIADLPVRTCGIGGSGKWFTEGTKGRHTYLEVTPGHNYLIKGSFWTNGWVTSDYSTTTAPTNNTNVPFVSGTSLFAVTDGQVITAPEGASYLILTLVDGGGSQSSVTEVDEIELGNSFLPLFNQLNEKVEKLDGSFGEITDTNTVLDLESYNEGEGVLYDGQNSWYKATGFTHIAIPVTAGDTYIVKASNSTYYGLLKSYSGSNTAPSYSASSTRRQNKTPGTYVITIPSDCTYIVFSKLSGGYNVLPQFMCKWPKVMPFMIEQMSKGNSSGVFAQKIHYAHWNVGHFTYYDKRSGGSSPSISEADSPAMQLRYKKMLNKVHADIIGICEYDPVFDAVNTPTKSTIFGNYKYQYDGTKYGYQCNSIFSQIVAKSEQSVTFASKPSSGNSHTYYRHCVIVIGGVEVHVVETHLNWETNESTGKRYAFEQMDELISAFGAYGHVIISGDFNFNDIDEYQPFVDAGYTLVNGSYLELDTFLSYLESDPPIGAHLDNIIVKGFAVSNIQAWDESGYTQDGLSDHSMISCDLILIP